MDSKVTGKAMRVAPGDTIAICSPSILGQEARERILALAKTQFPNNVCVVLDGGLTIGVVGQQEQMDRIEAKLDILIDALAEEGEEEQAFDLDGNPLPDGGGEGEAL